MNENKKIIKNIDLLNNKYKYTIDELEYNINHLNKNLILKTQKLTYDFCNKHLLNSKNSLINSGNEDSFLFDKYYIILYQPHLNEEFEY